jgi:hypothetical protein
MHLVLSCLGLGPNSFHGASQLRGKWAQGLVNYLLNLTHEVFLQRLDVSLGCCRMYTQPPLQVDRQEQRKEKFLNF